MMKSLPLSNAHSDSFQETFDEYVRRVTSRYGINEVIYEQRVVNKIDFSDLSNFDQQGFESWLDKRFYMKLGIVTALQRGLSVKVSYQQGAYMAISGKGYTIRIEGC